MKLLWIMIISAMLLCSCDVGGESRDAVCRHKAIMAALIYAEHYPVRIAWGPINEKEGYHAQAQVYIGGEWCFLHVIPSQIYAVTDEQDDWFTVERTFSLEEYIDIFWFSRGFGNNNIR